MLSNIFSVYTVRLFIADWSVTYCYKVKP